MSRDVYLALPVKRECVLKEFTFLSPDPSFFFLEKDGTIIRKSGERGRRKETVCIFYLYVTAISAARPWRNVS